MESKSILEILKNFEKDNTYKKILINVSNNLQVIGEINDKKI